MKKDLKHPRPEGPRRDNRWHELYRTGLLARLLMGDSAVAAARSALEVADAAAEAIAAPPRESVPVEPPPRPSPGEIGSTRAHTTR